MTICVSHYFELTHFEGMPNSLVVEENRSAFSMQEYMELFGIFMGVQTTSWNFGVLHVLVGLICIFLNF